MTTKKEINDVKKKITENDKFINAHNKRSCT